MFVAGSSGVLDLTLTLSLERINIQSGSAVAALDALDIAVRSCASEP